MKIKLLISMLLIITGVLTTKAQYTNILTFAGASFPFGSGPQGDAFVYDGTFLYGTTLNGGSSNDGVIFKVMPDGSGYSELFDFAGSNGKDPYGSLIYDGTFLYGMTVLGGTGTCSSGCGLIFKIKTDGTGFDTVMNFNGINGKEPEGSLLSVGSFLYGMTETGGISNMGTIFKIMPNGTGYTKLLDFTGSNGLNPVGSLIYDGIFLYGTTESGGANGMGTIFKIMPDGTGYMDLLDFSGTNGLNPEASLIYDGTFLYGTTLYGGANNDGVIFKIKPDGTGYTNLLSFSGTANGSNPNGNLISEGPFLYGLTTGGGLNGDGTIFKIMPDGSGYSDLYDFVGSFSGKYPNGSLISDGSCLYGMAQGGDVSNDGIVFRFCDPGMGIKDNKVETDFNVYPNPTNELLSVNAEGFNDFENAYIMLFDYSGRLVLKEKMVQLHTQINVGGLSSGLYFLQMQNGNKTTTKKFIKE